MTGLAFDDIDEDLDEMDDEDIDEALREDDELAERRRRGRRGRGAPVKGGGYSQPRAPQQQSYVTQTQLQAALNRVGTDVRKLAANTSALENRIDQAAVRTKRSAQQTQQAFQLTALLPLLIRPKTITLGDQVANIPRGTRIMIDEGDSLTTLLPRRLIMMGGRGGQGQAGTGNDSMMMLLVVLLLTSSR